MDREIARDDRPDHEPLQGRTREKLPARPAKNVDRSAPQSPANRSGHEIERPLNEPAHYRPQPARSPDSSRGVPVDQDRGREYRLSQNVRETVKEIGRFRTLAVYDLARQKYAGDVNKSGQDLRSLKAQGLVQLRTIWAGKRQGKLEFVALTRAGKRLLESEGSTTGQIFYDRFVKPAEILHDAAIYRMYQAERESIEKAGGTIRRVILDYELKQKAYSPLAKAKALSPLDYARRQEEIARENGLEVVQGHITLPDLRIEYDAADGQQTSVDLELATEHYRGSHLAAKAEAGFKMYATEGSAGRLSSALEERELLAEIFSL